MKLVSYALSAGLPRDAKMFLASCAPREGGIQFERLTQSGSRLIAIAHFVVTQAKVVLVDRTIWNLLDSTVRTIRLLMRMRLFCR